MTETYVVQMLIFDHWIDIEDHPTKEDGVRAKNELEQAFDAQIRIVARQETVIYASGTD